MNSLCNFRQERQSAGGEVEIVIIIFSCVAFNVPGAIGPGVPLCTLVPRDVQFKKKKKKKPPLPLYGITRRSQ